MKNLFLIVSALALLIGCATGGGAIDDVLQQSAVSTSTYLICQNNPAAIPAVMAVCQAPESQLADALAELYAQYDGAIEDPFLKLQADIILQAFADQYGVDLLALDLSNIPDSDLQPFVDLICTGAVAAAAAQ